jgi:SAM-dependent methyltransferase
MDIKEETILGDTVGEHWYYRAKLAALHRSIRHLGVRRILDVGAGSGFFSKGLLRLTNAREALCVDPNYPLEHDERIDGKPVRFRRHCAATNAELVLMMDVLEHVEDDVGLLRAYALKVASGTRLLITVPAFQFLWSGHDVFLEHKRRYTLGSLTRVVAQAGLTPESRCYFFGLVFPLAAATRLIDRLRPGRVPVAHSQLKAHSPLVNTALSGLCALDLRVFQANRIAGLSVFCLAHKP